jgi:DNA-binding response OmpR family regulator
VLRRSAVDVVLLDLVLPDLDGLTLLRAIRATRPQLPVIALTALDETASKLKCFDGGADDYVTKPFSIAELAARIRARLRTIRHGGTRLEVGALMLDLTASTASTRSQTKSASFRS